MEYLRLSSVILALAGLVIYIVLAVRRPALRLYLIAPISWLVFTLIFLSASYANQVGYCSIDPVTLNAWSAAVRLYSLTLVIGVGVVWLIRKPTGELPDEFR